MNPGPITDSPKECQTISIGPEFMFETIFDWPWDSLQLFWEALPVIGKLQRKNLSVLSYVSSPPLALGISMHIPRIIHGFLWTSIVDHTWICMDIHGYPQIIHRYPWIIQERPQIRNVYLWIFVFLVGVWGCDSALQVETGVGLGIRG